MSRRDQIAMTYDEVAAFLDDERTITCATLGRDGWPHLAPLWFVVRDGQIWGWTFAKSQKTRNLERDPRASLQVESGLDYDKLRGVTFECDVLLHRDLEFVTGIGIDLMERYTGGAGTSAGAEEMVRLQAPKRVGLQFVERRRASWDHAKLGGTY
ncbi:MAG: pyridoxamine 5'-phosphate oxidase family protein [Thermocrispum sp.]